MLFRLTDFGCFRREIHQRSYCSKHSQVQVCSSLGKRAHGLAALCPVYLIFMSYNSQLGVTALGMSHRTCTFQETGNFSKTFDDQNTAT